MNWLLHGKGSQLRIATIIAAAMARTRVQGMQLQTLLQSGLQVCCITLPAAEDNRHR